MLLLAALYNNDMQSKKKKSRKDVVAVRLDSWERALRVLGKEGTRKETDKETELSASCLHYEAALFKTVLF